MRVKIGPSTYDVHFDKAKMNAESVRQEVDLGGTIRYCEGFIVVDPTFPPDRQRIILAHEILHGLLEHVGLVTFPKKLTNEQLVTALAPILTEFLVDNPEAVAFIRGEG